MSDFISDKIICSVYYGPFGRPENLLVNWEIDVPQNSVMYRSNPVLVSNEPAWTINLNADEVWGFYPLPQGKWNFQHYASKALILFLLDCNNKKK